MKEKEYEKLTEEQLVALAKQNDEIALDIIFHRYKRQVKAKAHVYFIVGGDEDDSIQEGMIGLFRAIRDYDEQKNCNFSTFAQLCITRQIITAIKRASRKKHSPLNSSISISQAEGEEGKGSFLDTLVSGSSQEQPEESMIDKETVMLFEQKMQSVLSPLEKEVLYRMREGQTYVEIAETMGKEKKAIDNAIQRIKRKLR